MNPTKETNMTTWTKEMVLSTDDAAARLVAEFGRNAALGTAEAMAESAWDACASVPDAERGGDEYARLDSEYTRLAAIAAGIRACR